MIIIAAKNAFLKKRTGIEEYMWQLLRSLAKSKVGEEVIVYTNKIEQPINFPSNFHLKIIRLPFLWTQIGLSFKMLKIKFQRRDPVLFIPAHVIPLVHPKKTVVTIHGLEYEYFPQCYSWFSRYYLKFSTRYATHHAWKIIAASRNTKKDLVKIYKADPSKIAVIYHGVNKPGNIEHKARRRHQKGKKYFLYLGRIELKKNILGIIEAFEKFKLQASSFKLQDHQQDYKLVLAGPPGYGYPRIKRQILKMKNRRLKKEIIFLGYVGEEKKRELLKNTAALVFPSFYEGFGMPILEAQAAGAPVITSNSSSMKEITEREFSISKFKTVNFKSALLINPNKPKEIAEAMYRIVSDKKLKDELIRRGYENMKRFSWKKCAQKTLEVISGTKLLL